MDHIENHMMIRDRVKHEANESLQDLRAISKDYKEEKKMNNYYNNTNNSFDISQENTRFNRKFDHIIDDSNSL